MVETCALIRVVWSAERVPRDRASNMAARRGKLLSFGWLLAAIMLLLLLCSCSGEFKVFLWYDWNYLYCQNSTTRSTLSVDLLIQRFYCWGFFGAVNKMWLKVIRRILTNQSVCYLLR